MAGAAIGAVGGDHGARDVDLDPKCWVKVGRLLPIAANAPCRVEEAPLPIARTIVDAKRERLAKRVQDSLPCCATFAA